VTPAFTYADGLPLDLGPHGTLSPEDDLFGDLFTGPRSSAVEAPCEHQGAADDHRPGGDRPANGSETRIRAKRR
jgi:hypothetical protein